MASFSNEGPNSHEMAFNTLSKVLLSTFAVHLSLNSTSAFALGALSPDLDLDAVPDAARIEYAANLATVGLTPDRLASRAAFQMGTGVEGVEGVGELEGNEGDVGLLPARRD